ncbi:related to iron ascorbate family oxidoreductases [Lecanosticta acicola]|uniref:Related to iron ascorbate family oxidoreductases n=1 Tax=Lecanosticta acicola TaxID=111012 RepID=A0AAI8Z0B7_9PEZI|nr:related to iron ascorbate family oxidoreductases [Lecanosticta acicola]
MATETQTVPGVPFQELPEYQQAEESKHELDWADLITLDLSQFDAPNGKQKLANQLRDAVHNVGFFYITNFGLTQTQINRQFAIGKQLFALPEAEKLKYRADLENGHYSGYRPQGTIELFPGLRDNVEMYNVFKFLPALQRSHPAIITAHRAEIERFQRAIAQDIIPKLLTLISLILELPDEAHLSRGHEYSDPSDCHLRYMIYRARSAQENARFQNIYSRGHTDFGSLTLLFRQPIAALQIRTREGEWKWVRPHPESITVNIADVLQFWTNGYLKSSVHRVVAPPDDQAHLDRLGLLYFLRPTHDLDLKTVDSPLLKRLGLKKDSDDDEEAAGIKAGDWVRMRVKQNQDRAVDDSSSQKEREKEVLGGVKVKYYD